MQNDLVAWLLTNYGQEQMRPGLDRISHALKELLPTFNKTKIITIAGTNGKGETTLRLSELLKNRKHFVWTSPHIERITERFRNENGEIPYKELETLIKDCHEKVLQNRFELSFYEFLFFVFCTWASKSNPEILLLEVGLGGRLDAVNVFDADLVLLPSISRDHQEILGNRYDLILKEKLGTLRSKTTLIHFLHSQYLREKAADLAQAVGAKCYALEDVTSISESQFSERNYLLSAAAVCHLQNREFRPVEWPIPSQNLEHRGEFFRGKNDIVFFGSHNVDGVRKLIQFLKCGTYNFPRPPYDAVIIAFSKRDPRDLQIMLRMFHRAGIGKVIVTVFDHPKAASQEVVEDLVREEGLKFVKDIEEYVQGTNKHQRLLVAGSYYFLGQFKNRFCTEH